MQHDRGANYPYNVNHITVHKCIRSICCTPYAYTMSHIKHILIKKKKESSESFLFFPKWKSVEN